MEHSDSGFPQHEGNNLYSDSFEEFVDVEILLSLKYLINQVFVSQLHWLKVGHFILTFTFLFPNFYFMVQASYLFIHLYLHWCFKGMYYCIIAIQYICVVSFLLM